MQRAYIFISMTVFLLPPKSCSTPDPFPPTLKRGAVQFITPAAPVPWVAPSLILSHANPGASLTHPYPLLRSINFLYHILLSGAAPTPVSHSPHPNAWESRGRPATYIRNSTDTRFCFK